MAENFLAIKPKSCMVAFVLDNTAAAELCILVVKRRTSFAVRQWKNSRYRDCTARMKSKNRDSLDRKRP